MMLEENQSLTEQKEQQQRIVALERVIRILVGVAVLFIIIFILLYWQRGGWQLLLQSGVTLVTAVAGFAALQLIRRGRPDAAGYLALCGIAVILQNGTMMMGL